MRSCFMKSLFAVLATCAFVPASYAGGGRVTLPGSSYIPGSDWKMRYSGEPSDPILANRRSMFRNGHAPTDSDLRLGLQWDCNFKYADGVSLNTRDVIVKHDEPGLYTMTRTEPSTGEEWSWLFRFNESGEFANRGIVMENGYCNREVALDSNVRANGSYLVIEADEENKWGCEPNYPRYRPVVKYEERSLMYAWGYALCKLVSDF